MKKITTLIVVSVLLVFAAIYFGMDTKNNYGKWDKSSLMRGEIKQLVFEKKFKELEKLVHEARARKERYTTSYWVLQDLYNGIPYMMSTFEGVYEFVDEWRKASPESSVPDIIEARAFIARAWQVRGSARIKNVSDNEYRGFKDYLSKAWDSIIAAEKKIH